MDIDDLIKELPEEEDEDKKNEYERRRRERIRRRRIEQQRRRRRMQLIRLAAIAAICVLIVGLGGTTVVKAIINKTKGAAESAVVEVQAKAQDEPNEAVRQPIKDSNNAGKLANVSTGWQTDENGSWYQNADGSYFVSGWKEIEGQKYFFDENGYIKTGWVEVDGEDFYFDEQGKYDASIKKPMVALTFDDGPGKFTDMLLDCLEQYQSKATFFLIGENAQKFPEQLKREKELGMEIGNHTWDHQILTNLDMSSVAPEITRTNEAVSSVIGQSPTLMRPPGGAYNNEVLEKMGLPVIMWSIDTKDWKTKNVQNTIDVTLNNVKDGSIVLMHDIHETSVQAALQIIPALVNQGYKLVTVSELAKAKGIELAANTPYFYFGDGEQSVE